MPGRAAPLSTPARGGCYSACPAVTPIQGYTKMARQIATALVLALLMCGCGGGPYDTTTRPMTDEERAADAAARERRAAARQDELERQPQQERPARQPARPPQNPAVASADTWNDGPWPLTIDGGVLTCTRVAGTEALYITDSNGRMWPLNGAGQAHHARWGAESSIDPVWRENPQIPGTRINIGPLIQRARARC